MPEPYLSVVATARNDDHGGDPLYRLQLFVEGLAAQCDLHRLPAELVLVEWNPPADRPRLADVVRWPQGAGHCEVRIVEVPHALHAELEHSDRLPLFQMIGKNVGIRRARGRFVLATNIDILFSDELAAELAEQQLDPRCFYRADRVDVPAEIDPAWPHERRLAFCREHALRVNAAHATLDLATGRTHTIVDETAGRHHLLRYTARRLRSPRLPRAGLRRFVRASRWEKARVDLHTNASGDFTLMSAEGWREAGGYPELQMYSMHLDGLLLYQAYYAGLRERRFAAPVYHIEHGGGFKPDSAELGERLERDAIPQVTNEQLMDRIYEMYETQRPKRFNDDDWGFRSASLPETVAA